MSDLFSVITNLRMELFEALVTGAGRRAKWLVASAWVLSITFSIPIIFLYHLAVPEGMAAQFGVQVSFDWWRAGHVTAVLISDWFRWSPSPCPWPRAQH